MHLYSAYSVQNSERRFRGAGSASGSTSGSTSGSQKSPKCTFVQRIWYRIVRDTFGVPEVLPEVFPEVLPEVLPEVGSCQKVYKKCEPNAQ